MTANKPEDIAEIIKIKTIASFRVTWESYRSARKITQWFRCQEFGHGISNCCNPPKRVKCTSSHLTENCENTNEDPAVCANCQCPHPANWKQCPKYIDYLNKVEKQ